MRTLALASVVLISGLATSARAQSVTNAPPATDAPPSAEAPADHEAAASALVEQAAQAYDQNQLDEALQLLARAFALSPRPSILYNQAQVLRAKDDCVAALDAYRRFIAATAPDDPDRERALHRRDEMQACADQRAPRPKPVEPPPPAPPPQAPPALVPPAPAPPVLVVSNPVPLEDRPVNHRRALRAAGWAALGVGVVAAGVAAAYAWEAHHIQGELQDELQGQLNTALSQRSPWTETEQSQYMEGTRDASRAWWCVGAAALAGAGGGALLILSRPPAAGGAVAGTPSESRGALIGWSGTF